MRRFFSFVFFSFVLLGAGVAWADTTIAVVDVQALLTNSSAAKSVEAQVDAQKEKFLAELGKQEQTLRDNEKNLTTQRETLAKDEFSKRAETFEESLVETRRLAQTKKRAYDEASSKALGQLRDKLYEIVQAIAKERGYTLVISKQNVIVGASSLDITDEAMKRLNAALPDIKLEISEQ